MGEASFLMSKSSGVDITMEFDGPYSVRMSFDNRRGEREQVHAVKESNGWNSMHEIPEDGETILCIDDCENYHIAVHGYDLHDKRLWCEIATGETISNEIKWWMPLPEQPKED